MLPLLVLNDSLHTPSTVWLPGSRTRQAGFRESILLRELLDKSPREKVRGAFYEEKALRCPRLQPVVLELLEWLFERVTLPSGCLVGGISAATSGSAHWELLRESVRRLDLLCESGRPIGCLLRRTVESRCWWCGRKYQRRAFFEAQQAGGADAARCVCGERTFVLEDYVPTPIAPAADPMNQDKRRPGSDKWGLERPKRRRE